MSKIFIISGPSGAGKGTVIDSLLKNQSLNLYWAKSYTTRPERGSDKTEHKYIFVSEDKFKELETKGKVLESNFYNHHWYGTAKSEIDQALTAGRNVIKDIDIHGAAAFRKLYPDSVLIFLTTSLENLKSRMVKRGQNTQEEIAERLKIAQTEIAQSKNFDYVVENPEGRPKKAIEEIEKIIKNSMEGKNGKF